MESRWTRAQLALAAGADRSPRAESPTSNASTLAAPKRVNPIEQSSGCGCSHLDRVQFVDIDGEVSGSASEERMVIAEGSCGIDAVDVDNVVASDGEGAA